MISSRFLLTAVALASGASAHIAAWSQGMYCKNDYSDKDMPNASLAALPLHNLTYNDWFLNGKCRNYPPPAGEFLNIPANGQFTVELSSNRGQTTLSFNGAKATDWPDGKTHPANWSIDIKDPAYPPSGAGCISSPNIHAKRESDAAGTAFAIAYKSDITNVSLSDFTVFSVAPNTPYKRVVTFQVPNLPACPQGGCICAWSWLPNNCGTANMYQHPYRCQVTGASPTAKAVGSPKPAVWCESDQTQCLAGPKQMTAAFQADGNNVKLPNAPQKDGQWASPGYNLKMGFKAGAQTDIFSAASAVVPAGCPAGSGSGSTTTVTVTVTASPKPTKRSIRHALPNLLV